MTCRPFSRTWLSWPARWHSSQRGGRDDDGAVIVSARAAVRVRGRRPRGRRDLKRAGETCCCVEAPVTHSAVLLICEAKLALPSGYGATVFARPSYKSKHHLYNAWVTYPSVIRRARKRQPPPGGHLEAGAVFGQSTRLGDAREPVANASRNACTCKQRWAGQRLVARTRARRYRFTPLSPFAGSSSAPAWWIPISRGPDLSGHAAFVKIYVPCAKATRRGRGSA